MNVIEAMETCTAMRYFREDPVPRDVVTRLIHAATRASSPGNSQGWEFVIVDDAAAKAEIGAAVKTGMGPAFANKPQGLDGVASRMYAGAEHLANNFEKVPVWIVGCARKVYPPQAPSDVFMYSTIYPAAQNLIVAARSMDIGSCFTTFHHAAEPVIRKVLQDSTGCASVCDGGGGLCRATLHACAAQTRGECNPLEHVLMPENNQAPCGA